MVDEKTSEFQVPLHSHCIVCGRPIRYGEMFCSEACRRQYENMVKTRRRMSLIMWALMMAIIAIIIISTYFL